jgi:hypothetical protein
MHRQSGLPLEPTARVSGSQVEDSTMRAPSLDELISSQNRILPLPAPTSLNSGPDATASIAR